MKGVSGIVHYLMQMYSILMKLGLLALMLPGTHPNHLAIEVDPNRYPKLDFKQHRDGSNYHYLTDPWGNYVELINYGLDLDENT